MKFKRSWVTEVPEEDACSGCCFNALTSCPRWVCTGIWFVLKDPLPPEAVAALTTRRLNPDVDLKWEYGK